MTAASRAASLSIMVRALKADVTRRAGVELGWTERIWQHNYFDRVIHDDREFSNVMRYMAENPLRWQAQALRFSERHGHLNLKRMASRTPQR